MCPGPLSEIGSGVLPGTWSLKILPAVFANRLSVMGGVNRSRSKFLDNSGIFSILTCFKFVVALTRGR